MKFMTTKEVTKKWNISERRIRQLLQDGRIERAVKVGNNWNISVDTDKPVDKRIIKPDDNKFIIDLDDNYFDEVDRLKYYEILDKAHTTGDYTDFVKLVTKLEIEMLNKCLELL